MVESLRSLLPLCDEIVVAAGDSNDDTTALVRSIDPRKIRVIETVWDPALFVRGAIFAQQTDIALDACRGDWAFYLQADEVIHERFRPVIAESMRRHLEDPSIEGLLFDYLHFFGDYDHVQTSHNWYGREVRVVRTGAGVRSWHDAQGFRRGGEKLRVAHSGACVFHYGWVRSPDELRPKVEAFDLAYRGGDGGTAPGRVGYGRLCGRRRFRGTHPAVMRDRVARAAWRVAPTAPVGHKHDRLGIRLLSLVENNVLGFRVGERRNYVLADGAAEAGAGLVWRKWIS